jgi:glutamine synthetase
MQPLRDFLEIPYDQLEEMNLAAKAERAGRRSPGRVREARMKFLADEKRIKAVTVCFTDLEGRFHMLDYDKKFLLKSADNLTFDGSSIRGFSAQVESDLRLALDWPAMYILPSDVFGPGKVLIFGEVQERDGSPYRADMRARLKALASRLWEKSQTVAHVSNEIEGFVFKGRDAERRYRETGLFDFISTGGYYHSLPGDDLRRFIDSSAEVQRALGFANEKDHPEVAPSQFEMNYSYTEATIAADQVQLYKLVARQVAAQMEMTASFLPKPVAGVNGNGMHTNISLSRRGKNLFHAKKGQDGLSVAGWKFIQRILSNANDLCLILNSSVNSYRRLDPHYEAPNQIKASPIDRGQPVHGDLLAAGHRHRRSDGRGQRQAPAHPLPARQHLRRDATVQGEQVHHRAARRRGGGAFRRAQARLRGTLSEGARQPRQAERDHVPPRGDQPVPLVDVLSRPGTGFGRPGPRGEAPAVCRLHGRLR